jgi:DNA polymerase
MDVQEKQHLLETIAQEIRACKSCPLHSGRTHAVPGEGPFSAQLMFVGEAPGFHEDQQARPFVGASGRYLEELLRTIGLTREDVFITNIVRCRPPENRDPLQSEIQACQGYLDRQIAVLQPLVIATLGRFSMAYFIPQGKISKIHGQPVRDGQRVYFPLFHPAAVLRTPSLREVMAADFKMLKSLLDDLAKNPPSDDSPSSPPKQLPLF